MRDESLILYRRTLRVALAHVDEVDGEILACGYCGCRDGNQQECEKGYLHEPLKLDFFIFLFPLECPISD